MRVLEREELVGGLARTEERDGFRFDLGGHRFFTKHPEIQALWEEILGDELIVRPRLSRIRYGGRMFAYPLDALDVVRNLGPSSSPARSGPTCARVRRRARPTRSRSGSRGASAGGCTRCSSPPTPRRCGASPAASCAPSGPPSASAGCRSARRRARAFKGVPDDAPARCARSSASSTTRASGPGQMWDAMRDRVEALGGRVLTGRPPSLHVEDGRVVGVSTPDSTYGAPRSSRRCRWRRSPGPLARRPRRRLAAAPRPALPRLPDGRAHPRRPDPFPDTWIYVHEPGVRVARIQNFRAWSPAMVPDPTPRASGLEYFCFEGDDLWRTDDATLVELAARELDALGLGGGVRVGHVVRVPHAYPIYDADYASRVSVLRDWVDSVAGLQQIGRNGLHRYNNLDHSMLTAARAVENLCDGARHDVWSVNADSWYHEEVGVTRIALPPAPETPALQSTIA